MASAFRQRRRELLTALAAAPAWLAMPAAAATSAASDVDILWRALRSRYVRDEGARDAMTPARLAAWRAAAAKARSREPWGAVVRGLVAALADDEVRVADRGARPVRRVPSETDLWARWRDGAAIVEAVRPGSEADSAGIHPGHRVENVQGFTVERAVRDWAGAKATALERDRALRHLLAGPWSGPFTLDVRDPGGRRQRVEIERSPPAPREGALVPRRMGERRDLGYVRLRDALGDAAFTQEVDLALDALADARALMLDLRDASSAGSLAVVAAIAGRFVPAPRPFQSRQPAHGKAEVDAAIPRGERIAKPVVALVDRWTAAEGEALAAGLLAAGATLVGTAMAGCRGDEASVALPHAGIEVRFPASRPLLPDGSPRAALAPAVPVDLAAPSGGPGDPILYQALKTLA